MKNDLTEEEFNGACDALIAWFKSQEIAPAAAVLIMIDVMASQLVMQNEDKPSAIAGALPILSRILGERIESYSKAIE